MRYNVSSFQIDTMQIRCQIRLGLTTKVLRYIKYPSVERRASRCITHQERHSFEGPHVRTSEYYTTCASKARNAERSRRRRCMYTEPSFSKFVAASTTSTKKCQKRTAPEPSDDHLMNPGTTVGNFSSTIALLPALRLQLQWHPMRLGSQTQGLRD